jgi:hypothetical protein
MQRLSIEIVNVDEEVAENAVNVMLQALTPVVDHIKKHIPQEHHAKIFDTFVDKLWHPSAQETSVDRETDRKVKQGAYDFMARHFPGEALARKEKTDQQVTGYYDPNNPKKFKLAKGGATIPSADTSNNPGQVKESEDDHHHVVFAAGRFTGFNSLAII